MGAWGAGSFDNDDALDWVSELECARDASIVRDALTAVADAGEGDYVEAPDASAAIAAAAVVAASFGAPGGSLPDEVQQWLAGHGGSIPRDMRELAWRAVSRARKKSELRELWDEADDPEWLAATGDLLGRLGE